MEILRIWNKVNIKEIEDSIVIVDDKFGFCPACKEISIKLEGLKNCPKCGRQFKYATSREAKPGDKGIAFILRAMKKLPELTFVDYEDYEYITKKKKAEGLFGGI
jgi:hypothetical protein